MKTQQKKPQTFQDKLNEQIKVAQAKRMPFRRETKRDHEVMSGPCFCGATRDKVVDGKVVKVPRSLKRCHGRLGAVNAFQPPNNLGNYLENQLLKAQKKQAKIDAAQAA